MDPDELGLFEDQPGGFDAPPNTKPVNSMVTVAGRPSGYAVAVPGFDLRPGQPNYLGLQQSAEQERAAAVQRRAQAAERIPIIPSTSPIDLPSIDTKFRELLDALSEYRSQISQIIAETDTTRQIISTNGGSIRYNPRQNLIQHIKKKLSEKARTDIMNGASFEITDRAFTALSNSLNEATVMGDEVLTSLAQQVGTGRDVFLELRRDILEKEATINNINRKLKDITATIENLRNVFAASTVTVQPVRVSPMAVRYGKESTVPKRSWLNWMRGKPKPGSGQAGGTRHRRHGRTLTRRAAARATKSHLRKSRSRRRSSGGRERTRRHR